MIYTKIVNNIKSFLYDQEYFINIYENVVYVFNYLDLLSFSDKEVNLKMANFNIKIQGENLIIVKMMEKEILVKGKIEGLKLIK